MKLGNSVALFPHCFSVYPFTNFSYIVFWWKIGGIININYLCCNKIDN